jgi:hypothetical protein
MKLNSNISSFKALMRKSYWTKNEDHDNDFLNIVCFGIQSVPGKILTFHVLTDSGMMRSRVPISEIYLKEPKIDEHPHFKQLWDCFSENVAVIAYDFLAEHKCQVILRDKEKVWATYMFTVDWYRNPYSDEPTDYKCGHVLAADDGYLLCMPNNRIFWRDSNFVTKPLPDNLKEFKVDTELMSVENISNIWVEDTDSYYYDFNEHNS